MDVSLDKDLKVVGRDVDDRDDDFDDFGEFEDDRDDDADDRALSAAEQSPRTARNSVDGGTVTDVEAGDDFGEAYEVEVVDRDLVEWDVELDADFKVLSKTVDD